MREEERGRREKVNNKTVTLSNRQTDRRTDGQTNKTITYPLKSKQKIRIKFTKGEEIKYISHLDMVRAFIRAMRRARLPVALSEGFVPREKISFSHPLPLGLTSKSEYADIEFSNFINPGELKEKLNKELPPGLRVEEAEIVPLKSKSLMATFDCAEYEVKLSDVSAKGGSASGGRWQIADIRERIKKFLAQREIIIKRKMKKGIREIDIRPLILKLELKGSALRMLLKINVRPQEVVKTLLNLSKEETLKLIIERKDLLKV
ncbi:TIGR03936 family radical SAM-associated protein [bacterium]|nr:TIGR03936 family radical SAM-associated protein [bacterium]